MLVERDAELRELRTAVDRARAGAGTLSVVEGPAGIGKTTLVLEAAAHAAATGMAAAVARGAELERELGFGVVRRLLEPVLAAAGDRVRPDLLSGAAGLASPIFGAPGDAAAGPGGADRAWTVVHGLHWLCAGLAQARPLLLAVDDAHWADLPSLRFLAYLAERLEGLPLALVVAARPAEGVAQEDVLVRLATHPRAVVLAPAPLSAGAVAGLLAAGLGRAPGDAFAAACREATGGIPFLARELIRELGARGVAPVDAAAADVAELAPPTVARTTLARIRRLGPGVLAVAQAVAVLGADADGRTVAALTGVPVEDAVAAVDALVGAGLVRPGRPVEFAHPLIRAAVHGAMATGERGRLHALAAAVLDDDERVAAHLLATDPAGNADTVALLRRTARDALARGAPSSAVAHLERALSEPPPPALRADVLEELGTAELRAGHAAAAAAHLEQARALAPGGPRRGALARALVSPLMALGRHAEAAAALADALAEAGDEDAALALKGELLLVATLEPAACPDVEDRLGDLAADVGGGSPGRRAYLAGLTTHRALRMDPAPVVRELAARAREAGIVEELGSGAIGWANVLYPLVAADAFDEAEAMVADAFAHLRRRASVLGTARAYAARSFLRLRQGDLGEAAADARAAVDAGRDGGFQGWPIALGTLVEALVARGESADAAGAMAAAGLDGDVPDGFMTNWALHARAVLRLDQDRLEEAAADLEELSRRTARRGQHNPGLLAHRSQLAVVLLLRGDRDRAARLADEELALARRWGAPRALGVALRAAGLAAGATDGLALLRESVRVLEDSGARLELARSLVELGGAVRRAGRRGEAREPLHAGMELAHRCAAAPLVARARDELLATGARPRRIMRTGVESLTPGELRVARLAAGGMTNREVAQALFVTEKTVETHLGQVFRKLGVRARAELAGRLAAG